MRLNAARPQAPPVKIQGIKTRLVGAIAGVCPESIAGRWIEPFGGSMAVALNLRPERAFLADINPHLIRLYQGIQAGKVTGESARAHLAREGAALRERGEAHYYAVRKRFNAAGDPLDFLFVNRAAYNGLVRFNNAGHYNAAFCKKPERYRRHLVTRIANQIDWAAAQMAGREWVFACQDWTASLAEAKPGDWVYCDPPYVGRSTGYYDRFGAEDAERLAAALRALKAGFVLSMWRENDFRRNPEVDRWSDFLCRDVRHHYHINIRRRVRRPMTETLIVGGPGAKAAA